MLDTKSKNNRKKGLFCIFLCAVLPAVIMLAFYPFFGKRAHRNAEQEQMTETADQYENYFGISYIYSLFWKLGLIRVPLKIQEKWIKGV